METRIRTHAAWLGSVIFLAFSLYGLEGAWRWLLVPMGLCVIMLGLNAWLSYQEDQRV